MTVRSRAGGRVNVIGEHTDYTGGLVLPMAIDLGTTVSVERTGDVVRLWSDQERDEAVVPLDVADPTTIEPSWARYVAGVVAELRPTVGAVGTVSSTLPIGAGLSSSASLQVALAAALGFDGDAATLATACQRAEHRATGVRCGIMDQLAIAAGVEGALLLIDCASLSVTPHLLPDELCIIGIHSGETRTLRGSAYAIRRDECERAQRAIGPLRHATTNDVEQLADPVLRRRARHVVTENARVLTFVEALGTGRYAEAGALISESHVSLRDDFEVSTPNVDDLVARLETMPGVLGARMTGGGFGGVVIALCEADARVSEAIGGWHFRPSAGVEISR